MHVTTYYSCYNLCIMKLFYDARYIRPDFHDGISRYTTELANAVARQTTDVTFIICDEKQLGLLPVDCAFIKIHPPISPKEPFTSVILNKYKPDIVFSPLHTMGALGRRFKLILTSHDMIYAHHHEPPLDITNKLVRGLWRMYYITNTPQRIILNRPDMVNTVSESAKAEFIAARLTRRPILVTPNAPKPLQDLLDKLPDVTAQNPRNIVYMGAFIAYKNVETLILGMKYLPEYTLHLLSHLPPEFRYKQLLDIVPEGAKIVWHKGVSDQQYADILADNAVLASASLDEGFGLPVVEAHTLGVPTVLTDMPVFHEVAGEDGALFFDPHDPLAFADAIKQLDDPALRSRLSAAGKQHVKQYSWDASAKSLLAAMTSLLQ
jgi:glycosyltransferase involved in cell wall biosynthesis